MTLSMRGCRRRGGFPTRPGYRRSRAGWKPAPTRAHPWPVGVRKLACAGENPTPRKQASALPPHFAPHPFQPPSVIPRRYKRNSVRELFNDYNRERSVAILFVE